MFLGLKITDETLEDRLAFDEIFVEYFNAFLALPVSTQVMLYLIYHATYFYSQGSLIIQQISLDIPTFLFWAALILASTIKFIFYWEYSCLTEPDSPLRSIDEYRKTV